MKCSGLWAQLLANAIGVPMATRHGGALGTARHARFRALYRAVEGLFPVG